MIQPRRHLRSDVTTEVQARLLAGQLPVGRINESELAAELGISRTPLREALLVMEQRGIVESAMGRGFLVRPLTLAEAEELYPLLAVLEPMALRAAGPALAACVPKLRQLLRQMAETDDPDRLASLGQDWGECLRETCPNRKLATMLADLHRLSARYERANIAQLGRVPGLELAPLLAHHGRIVDAIEHGDYDQAAELTGASWRGCLAALRLHLPPTPAERP